MVKTIDKERVLGNIKKAKPRLEESQRLAFFVKDHKITVAVFHCSSISRNAWTSTGIRPFLHASRISVERSASSIR